MTKALVPIPTAEDARKAIEEVGVGVGGNGESIVISNAEEYEVVCDLLREVKSKQKILDERKKAISRPIDAAKRELMDLFREPEQKLAQAETRLKRAVATYTEEQRRIQARLEQEARDLQARLEAEVMAEAQILRDMGEDEAADDTMLSIPSVAPVEITRPKGTGVSTTELWKAEVTSLKDLVEAVATGKADIALLQANQTALNSLARSLKANANVPGVRFFAESSVSVRA